MNRTQRGAPLKQRQRPARSGPRSRRAPSYEMLRATRLASSTTCALIQRPGNSSNSSCGSGARCEPFSEVASQSESTSRRWIEWMKRPFIFASTNTPLEGSQADLEAGVRGERTAMLEETMREDSLSGGPLSGESPVGRDPCRERPGREALLSRETPVETDPRSGETPVRRVPCRERPPVGKDPVGRPSCRDRTLSRQTPGRERPVSGGPPVERDPCREESLLRGPYEAREDRPLSRRRPARSRVVCVLAVVYAREGSVDQCNPARWDAA